MNNPRDAQFAKKALSMGLINSQQISSCLKLQQKWQQKGKFLSLPEWLVRMRCLDYMGLEAVDSVLDQHTSQKRDVAFQIGAMFHHYKIQRELGAGGMGVVYQVFDTKLNRTLALKLILSSDVRDKDRQRFQREASITAQLQHPNIVKLYEVGQTPVNYFTMEYIQGHTLHDLIKKGKLEISAAAKIIQKVSYALDYAHERKVIHRDIKPANIIIRKNGAPMVMDFGLAKDISIEDSLSQSVGALGTPAYMSPEQANNEQVTDLSDLYSLGATLYEAITGRPPFQAESYYNIVQQILCADPIPPKTLNPDIPQDLELITLKSLSKEPKQRYNSAKEFYQDLDNFLQNRPIDAKPPTVSVRLKKFIARNKRLCVIASIITTVLFIATSGYIWIAYNHNQELIEEKEKAQQAKKQMIEVQKTVEQEKTNSLQAVREILIPLHKICHKYTKVQDNTKVLTKLRNAFIELEKQKLLAALTDNHKNIEILYLYALSYGRSAKTDRRKKALEVYGQIIKKKPDSAQIYFNRGNVYNIQQQYPQAEQDYNQALKIKPDYIEVYIARAKLYLNQNQYQKTEQDYNAIARLRPDYVEVYILRADLWRRQRNFAKADQEYSKAITIAPKNARVYYLRSFMFYQLGQFEKAKKDFTQLIDLKAYLDQVHNALACLYVNQNKYNEAQQHFAKSIAANKNYAEAYMNRGNLYQRMLYYDQAEKDYNYAIKLNPKVSDVYCNRGVLYAKKLKYAKAIADWKKAISLNSPRTKTLKQYIKDAKSKVRK